MKKFIKYRKNLVYAHNTNVADIDNENMCLYVNLRNTHNIDCDYNTMNNIQNELNALVKIYKLNGYAIVYINYC